MKFGPCVEVIYAPASLPVFDRTWKEKCLACAHLAPTDDLYAMRCTALIGRSRRNSQAPVYCISARDGACGPDAVLFKAAAEATA